MATAKTAAPTAPAKKTRTQKSTADASAAPKAPAKAAARKSTKTVAASAEKTTKLETKVTKSKVTPAEEAPKSIVPPTPPVARTTLASQAIWPFPIGPKP